MLSHLSHSFSMPFSRYHHKNKMTCASIPNMPYTNLSIYLPNPIQNKYTHIKQTNRLDPTEIHTVEHINTVGNPKKPSKSHVNKSPHSSVLHPKKSFSHPVLPNPITLPSKVWHIFTAVGIKRKSMSLPPKQNISVFWIPVVVWNKRGMM